MGQTDDFYDALETRSADEREADLMARLAGQIANAKQNAPYFTERLADIDPQAVTTREALARVPVTRKSDLIQLQKKSPPLGGLTTQPSGKLKRLFQSPGPIYEPEGYGT